MNTRYFGVLFRSVFRMNDLSEKIYPFFISFVFDVFYTLRRGRTKALCMAAFFCLIFKPMNT